MLTKNAQEFRSFLINQGINLDFVELDDGDTVVEIRESLECGVNFRMVVVFSSDDSMVGVYGLDFIQGINPMKKSYVYEAINELNIKYTYYKYIVDKEKIVLQSFALFNDNFDSNIVMKIIMGMMNLVNNDYSGLMKIIWS